MATLKTIQSIIDGISAGIGKRGTTGEALQDLVESLASVYGLFNLNNPDPGEQVLSGAWENITLWDGARDTRGVQDDLVNGQFVVKAGGGGRWELVGRVRFTCSVAGIYRVRPRAIRADESQLILIGQDEQTLTAGESATFVVAGINAAAQLLDTGDRMSLQIRGPAGAVITGKTGFFRCGRL